MGGGGGGGGGRKREGFKVTCYSLFRVQSIEFILTCSNDNNLIKRHQYYSMERILLRHYLIWSANLLTSTLKNVWIEMESIGAKLTFWRVYLENYRRVLTWSFSAHLRVAGSNGSGGSGGVHGRVGVFHWDCTGADTFDWLVQIWHRWFAFRPVLIVFTVLMWRFNGSTGRTLVRFPLARAQCSFPPLADCEPISKRDG